MFQDRVDLPPIRAGVSGICVAALSPLVFGVHRLKVNVASNSKEGKAMTDRRDRDWRSNHNDRPRQQYDQDRRHYDEQYGRPERHEHRYFDERDDERYRHLGPSLAQQGGERDWQRSRDARDHGGTNFASREWERSWDEPQRRDYGGQGSSWERSGGSDEQRGYGARLGGSGTGGGVVSSGAAWNQRNDSGQGPGRSYGAPYGGSAGGERGAGAYGWAERGGAFGGERSSFGSSRSGFSGRGPKGYTRSDDRIREDVCDRLSYDDEVDASDISVSVKDGEVTLEGTVDDRYSKHRAEDIADAVHGVRDVHNKLKAKKGFVQEVGDRLLGREEEHEGGHSGSGTRNNPNGLRASMSSSEVRNGS